MGNSFASFKFGKNYFLWQKESLISLIKQCLDPDKFALSNFTEDHQNCKSAGLGRHFLAVCFYLGSVHGLGVHGVLLDLLVQFVEPLSEDPPQGGFPRPTGSHHHHPCPLSQLLIQLQGLLDLDTIQTENAIHR